MAALFVASSVFGVSLAKTVPRAPGSSRAVGGRAGADLLEDDFLLLEDDFDESSPTLSEAFMVDEGSVARPAEALLSILGTKETGSEKTVGKPYALSLLINFMTICVVLSGCYRFYVERCIVDDFDSATANVPDTEECSTEEVIKMAQAIREDRADALAKMVSANSKLLQARDAYGCTALHWAAHSGATACLRLLMTQSAVDVDAKDTWEETPLHFAARQGSVAACELLLFHGAGLNAVNSADEAPLMTAGKAGHMEACEFLLARGATVGDCEDVAIPAVLSAAMLCRLVTPQ